jgi:hypothetical protein
MCWTYRLRSFHTRRGSTIKTPGGARERAWYLPAGALIGEAIDEGNRHRTHGNAEAIRTAAILLPQVNHMSKHAGISLLEVADRLAIRELIEAYAHCADRRDGKGQMALFTRDTHFVVYMNAKDPKPSQELHSREALAPVFADLNQYAATTHFVGQSTIFTLTNERATGEAYTLAHHITIKGQNRRLMLASLRYNDTFVKQDGEWLFAERLLFVDWVDERALS